MLPTARRPAWTSHLAQALPQAAGPHLRWRSQPGKSQLTSTGSRRSSPASGRPARSPSGRCRQTGRRRSSRRRRHSSGRATEEGPGTERLCCAGAVRSYGIAAVGCPLRVVSAWYFSLALAISEPSTTPAGVGRSTNRIFRCCAEPSWQLLAKWSYGELANGEPLLCSAWRLNWISPVTASEPPFGWRRFFERSSAAGCRSLPPGASRYEILTR